MENYVIIAEDRLYSEFLAEQELRHRQFCNQSRIEFHRMVEIYFNGNHRLSDEQLLARRREVNFLKYVLFKECYDKVFFFNLM